LPTYGDLWDVFKIAFKSRTFRSLVLEVKMTEHFATAARIAKSRERIQVSLTRSPIKDHAGRVIDASKMERDITDKNQSEARELQIISSAPGQDVRVDVIDRGCEVGGDRLDRLFDHFSPRNQTVSGWGWRSANESSNRWAGVWSEQEISEGGVMTFSITLRAKNQGEP